MNYGGIRNNSTDFADHLDLLVKTFYHILSILSTKTHFSHAKNVKFAWKLIIAPKLRLAIVVSLIEPIVH